MAKWTNEQKAAIDTAGCNILVNAAAGSGKTAVLVERIIKKVTKDKIDIDNLLVVTFTNAAAAEMRERIGAALTQKLHENPYDKDIRRQLILLSHADITTIDAFCLNVVRNHFHLLDIDPNFMIADGNEIKLLKEETIEELFSELYEKGDEGFLSLAKMYSANRNDASFARIITDIHEFTQSLAYPERWLDEKAKMFACEKDFSDSIWIKSILRRAEITLDECIVKYRQTIDYMRFGVDKDGDMAEKLEKKWGKYWSNINSELNFFIWLKELCKKGWDELYRGILECVFERVSGCKADEEEVERVKGIRNEVKDIFEKRIKSIINDNLEAIEHVIEKEMYPIVEDLVRVVKLFDEKLMEKKKKRGILDFSDIEHFCLELMTDGDGLSDVALELREKYAEILIDEYQDSNELQEEIFSKISDGKNMFMVGDMKQSIYRFRNTDPTLFKHKNETFSTEDGAINRKIILAKNFRSREGVLAAANELFEKIMSDDIGEITYNEEHRLNVGANYPPCENGECAGKAEYYVINTEQEQPLEWEEIKSIELEAKFVAKRINELKNRNYMVFDKEKGKYRKLENKDIVVLLRSVKTSAKIYSDVLNQAGIEAFAESEGYFSKNEVKMILSLIKLIDNPRQDIPLLAVLRSPIGGFSDNELADICDGNGVYEAFEQRAKNDDALGEKCKKFKEKLLRWRKYAKYMSSDKLIWTLYAETGLYSFVGGLPGGEERQANLRLLFERAKKLENSGFKGLFHFINLIDKMIERDAEMSPAKLIGENHNVVRIMSIHKSKGLEFPVTIISGMGKRFYKTVPSERIVLHKDLGFGMDYINYEKGYTYPTVTKHAIRNQAELENLSEEMRMLYVAMTRAREKLIITATAKNLDVHMKNWYKSDSDKADILSAGSFLHWSAPIAAKSEFWDFRVLDIGEVLETNQELPDIMQTVRRDRSNVDVKALFEYKYPFAESVRLPSKISVTEIKRRLREEAEDAQSLAAVGLIEKPAFLCEDKLTQAQKGTALHYVMQNIVLKEAMSEDYIKMEIERMMNDGKLSKAEGASIDVNRIASFFRSNLGKRMLRAKNVKREVPFEIGISACEIEKNLGEHYKDEIVILQGIIDCYFEEEDGIVLVDYKTDYYQNKDEIANKYCLQLSYYERAIKDITRKMVKEKYIYLFFKNDMIYYV
ncbi:MAG: helicase-exonuclease AddAB subunit AddA [Clostridia bacterium]|nr:helicase-exonuclease AddAB subunit AddA [Clostridia bacterium]